MGGAALGALRGLRGLGVSNLPKKTEKTVAAAKELNGFLQGFVEQVCAVGALNRGEWPRFGRSARQRSIIPYPHIFEAYGERAGGG